MAGIPAKALGQVAELMDTGLNKSNPGFNAKATAPKSTSPLHNRGLTVGGKMRQSGGGGKVSPKVVAAIKLHEQSSGKAPAAPHPAVAKNPANPGIKWG